MSYGSASETTITANIRPTTIKKPTNKQTPPINRETKIELSLELK